MALRQSLTHEARTEPREETLYRTRGRAADGAPCKLVVVNVSPNGMMARTERDFAVGDKVTLDLPLAGTFVAEVRWSLGGRIGCQFEREVPRAFYSAMLVAMR